MSDSPELEALFDSIAFPSEAPAKPTPTKAGGDTPELEALFDSISAETEEIGRAHV
jgi:hypothetical protein